MDVEYELDENDLVALARFQVNRSLIATHRYRIRRFVYLVGFGLLGFGTYFAFKNTLLSVVFGGLAVLIFALYPFYYRWALEKNIRRIVRQRATPGTYARRILRATPDGLEQVNEDSESKARWKLVDDVVVTPTHAFLSLEGTFSIVIPKARLGEVLFNHFLDTVRLYKENAGVE